jgi:hypothetical protein
MEEKYISQKVTIKKEKIAPGMHQLQEEHLRKLPKNETPAGIN